MAKHCVQMAKSSLPMDIIFMHILPRLPIKSLVRFKCVSKSFKSEISSPVFIKTQHLHALSSDDNRLLIVPVTDKFFHIYDVDTPYASPSICHLPIPKAIYFNYEVVASCECYLLIRAGPGKGDRLTFLNPATRTYRELPYILDHDYKYNARYEICHCVNDDYKVVRFVEFHSFADGLIREVMVYSLRNNSWKIVECNPTYETYVTLYRHIAFVVQNYLLHLIFFNRASEVMTRIGCFDMQAEQSVNDVPLPGILLSVEDGLRYACLGSLDGKLCLMGLDKKYSRYDLWVMKEYGVKESWLKLMSLFVPNGHNECNLSKTVYHPFAYRKGSQYEILCIRENREWFWYNLRRKRVVETGFRRPYYACCTYYFSYLCKGSLLNFPEVNRFKYEKVGQSPIPSILLQEDGEG